MKFNYLIKVLPFLTSLVLIVFFSISNQKHTTKIKILIWETPSLALGKYLAISTGSGFILSFLITNKLSNLNRPRLKKILKTKSDNIQDESNDYVDSNIFSSYDNTLIEREIKDPSPTINARFRVIGKTSKNDFDSSNINLRNVYDQETNELQDRDEYQKETNYENKNDSKLSIDWNDHSFLNW